MEILDVLFQGWYWLFYDVLKEHENSLFIKLTESHKVIEKEITNELLKTHLSHVKCYDIECIDCFPIN